MKPLVSVVVPVFNGLPFIQEAIASVLAQDYEPLEIVVVDNASTDGTTDFLQSINDDRVRVVYRIETQPASANWTQAVNEAQGDLIKLMCADDVLYPNALTTQVIDLQENPTAHLTASRRAVLNAAGAVVRRRHGLNGLRGQVSGENVIRACLHSGTNLLGEPVCVLFRSAAIKDAMPWDDRWPYMTDLATYAKVLEQGDLICNRNVLAAFRISTTSWSASLLAEQPRNFAAWRDWIIASKGVPWGTLDRAKSAFYLYLRTLARRAYFARERRRTHNF